MRRDHEAKLNEALDELFSKGFVAILWEDLYKWYNADRLGKTVYRDIIERWRGICEGYGQEEDDIPAIEELQGSSTWLLLRRKEFVSYEEKFVLLEERA